MGLTLPGLSQMNLVNQNSRHHTRKPDSSSSGNSGQEGSSGARQDLARVYKVQGVEVYIMNEPLRTYRVVSNITGGIKATSFLTGGLINASISQRVGQFVRRALKQDPDIDAVVYSSGKMISGVKFTDPGSQDSRGMARVHHFNGVPVFVMCEPIEDYSTNGTKGGGIHWASILTAGILNNSIEGDVDKMSSRVFNVQTQGIICNGSRHAVSIRFKP